MISKHVDRFKSGVYQISNLINGKKYVGSSVNIYNRKHTHINKLKNKNHSSRHLQSAYHKYGSDNFLFEVLEYCSNITEREQYWIDSLKPEYNKRVNAQNNIGQKLSKKSIKKMSDSLKKRYREGLKSYNQKHRWKKVEQYSLKGELIKIWDYPTQAEKSLKTSTGAILKACKKDSKFRIGFQWRYAGSNKKISKHQDNTVQSKKVKVTNIETLEESIYLSLKQCKENLGKGCGVSIRKGTIFKGKFKITWYDER